MNDLESQEIQVSTKISKPQSRTGIVAAAVGLAGLAATVSGCSPRENPSGPLPLESKGKPDSVLTIPADKTPVAETKALLTPIAKPTSIPIPTNTIENSQNNLEKQIAQQRIKDNLNNLKNDLGLDQKEVDKYLTSWNDENLLSFKILKDAKGNPAIILVVGNQFGLKEKENIEGVKKAIERINGIDPNIIKRLVNEFGLKAISADIAGYEGGFFSQKPQKDFGFSFDPRAKKGTILINELDTRYGPPTEDFVERYIATVIAESKGIYDFSHLDGQNKYILPEYAMNPAQKITEIEYLKKWIRENKLSFSESMYNSLDSTFNTKKAEKLFQNARADKAIFFKNWVEDNKDKMGKIEYNVLKMLYDGDILTFLIDLADKKITL